MIRFAPLSGNRKLWVAASTAALALGVAVPAAWASTGHPATSATSAASQSAAAQPAPSAPSSSASPAPSPSPLASVSPAAAQPAPAVKAQAPAPPQPADVGSPAPVHPKAAPVPAAAQQPSAAAKPVAAPAPAAPAAQVVYVAGSGGQAMVDRCIGPIHFTPLDSYALFIVEHDLCGGWAQFSGIQVGQKVTIAGYGTYTATARAQVPQGGTTTSVLAAFGHFSRAYLQTCIPGTSQMILIALD